MNFITRDVFLEKAGLVFHKGSAEKCHLCTYTNILIVPLVFLSISDFIHRIIEQEGIRRGSTYWIFICISDFQILEF